jgi:hypothetical protein
MMYFKREMLNREENFNSKFGRQPNVGVMNPIKVFISYIYTDRKYKFFWIAVIVKGMLWMSYLFIHVYTYMYMYGRQPNVGVMNPIKVFLF